MQRETPSPQDPLRELPTLTNGSQTRSIFTGGAHARGTNVLVVYGLMPFFVLPNKMSYPFSRMTNFALLFYLAGWRGCRHCWSRRIPRGGSMSACSATFDPSSCNVLGKLYFPILLPGGRSRPRAASVRHGVNCQARKLPWSCFSRATFRRNQWFHQPKGVIVREPSLRADHRPRRPYRNIKFLQ